MEDDLGAFCRHEPVALAGSGAGPLVGLSFAVKDVFHIAGHTTGFGHPDWLRTHGPETTTAVAVQRLLDAGARMVGKTHTDEMAYSLTGENMHYGTPVNPRDPARVPGGSSSGSVVAVAGGLVDFALGTDCGGSVRLPASYCGVLGMRPTHGRIPLRDVIPFASSFDVAGWFAQEPDVFEHVGRILLDDHAEPPSPSRLLLVKDAFAMVEPRVTHALEGAVSAAKKAVGPWAEVTVSADGLAAWMQIFRHLQAAEIWANHGRWIREVRPRFGPGIRERLDWAATVDSSAVTENKTKWGAVKARIHEVLGEGDILCLPSSPRIAPSRDTEISEKEETFRYQAMCLLCIAGLGGLPQVSLPLATLDGLPLGLSLVGPRGADTQLLALSRELMAGV